MKAINYFSPNRIEELKIIYNFYIKLNDDGLDTDTLEPALRAADLNPTSEELSEMINNSRLNMTFETFLYLIYRNSRCSNVKKELIDALKIIDKQSTGFISKEKLIFILKNIKKPISDEKIQELISKFDKDPIKIELIVENLINL